MSRAIKFRAWHPSSKEMVYFDNAKIAKDQFVASHFGLLLADEHPEGTGLLMQYTGLKDKNGLEIYEGDILTDSHFSWRVVFDDAAFMVECISHNQPVNNTTLPKILAARKRAKMPISVSGNVHEHPHLLPNQPGK